jgi:hypothetical protein
MASRAIHIRAVLRTHHTGETRKVEDRQTATVSDRCGRRCGAGARSNCKNAVFRQNLTGVFNYRRHAKVTLATPGGGADDVMD